MFPTPEKSETKEFNFIKFLFRPFETLEGTLYACVFFVFLFVFQAKPGTTNNHRTGLKEVSK